MSHSFQRSEFDEYLVFKQSENPIFPPPTPSPSNSLHNQHIDDDDDSGGGGSIGNVFSKESFQRLCASSSVLLLLIGYDVDSPVLCEFLDSWTRFQSSKNLRIVLTSRKLPSPMSTFPSSVY